MSRHILSEDPIKPTAVVWLLPIPFGLVASMRLDYLLEAPLFIIGAFMLTTSVWAWSAPAPVE